MIFVCVGSREYQFNRLLMELDRLVENGLIENDIYAQVGRSTYIPRHYEYTEFLSSDDFEAYQNRAEFIISHGGTGALIGVLKKGKSVIAVPRLEKHNEHIDDYQVEVAGVLEKEGYLKCVIDIKKLYDAIIEMKGNPIKKKYEKKSETIDIIRNFIMNN